jgi:hypothetical protein
MSDSKNINLTETKEEEKLVPISELSIEAIASLNISQLKQYLKLIGLSPFGSHHDLANRLADALLAQQNYRKSYGEENKQEQEKKSSKNTKKPSTEDLALDAPTRVDFLSTMYKFLTNPDNLKKYSDLTINLTKEQKKFSTFKLFLGLCSPVFQQLIVESKNNEVTVANLSLADFQLIHNYLLSEGIQLNVNNVEEISAFAQKFELGKLEEACKLYIEKGCNVENAFEWYLSSSGSDYIRTARRDVAKALILSNAGQLFQSQHFLKLSYTQLLHLIREDTLRVNELALFEALLTWADYQILVKQRGNQLPSLENLNETIIRNEFELRKAARRGPEEISVEAAGGGLEVDREYSCTSTEGFATAKSNVGVSSGRWYYQISMPHASLMQLGWVSQGFTCDIVTGTGVGDDKFSWAYDGNRLKKWHNGSLAYSTEKWKPGDVAGFSLDLDTEGGIMSFDLNGQDLGVAFTKFHNPNSGAIYYPAGSFRHGESIQFLFDLAAMKAKSVRKDRKSIIPRGFYPLRGDSIDTSLTNSEISAKQVVSALTASSDEKKAEISAKDRIGVLGELLNEVRFPLISMIELATHVSPTGLLPEPHLLSLYTYVSSPPAARESLKSLMSALPYSAERRRVSSNQVFFQFVGPRHGRLFQVEQEGRVVRNSSGTNLWNTIVSGIVLEKNSGTYYWRIELTKLNISNGYNVVIGVVPEENAEKAEKSDTIIGLSTSQGVALHTAKLTALYPSSLANNEYTPNSSLAQEGDIIGVLLDTDKQTIRFDVNDKELGFGVLELAKLGVTDSKSVNWVPAVALTSNQVITLLPEGDEKKSNRVVPSSLTTIFKANKTAPAKQKAKIPMPKPQ